jgi:integrase
MVLAMSRPWKHPETGSYYFRKAVPYDLRNIVGKREEKRSLRTKDPTVAKQRHAEVAAEVEREWKAHRSKPEPLSQREITGLAGILYDEWTSSLRDEPGPPDAWFHVLRLHQQAQDAGKLEQWVGPSVDQLLLKQGLRADEQSRARLIDAAHKAFAQAFEHLKRNAEGDYRPDPDADRFPAWEKSQAKSKSAKSDNESKITELLEGWWREAQAGGITAKTYESYSSTIAKLVAFLGHDEASRVTPGDVLRFKDYRLAQINPRTGKPISLKTVKDSDLAALKAVFGWAVRNHKVNTNAATGITLKVGKQLRLRPKWFTDDEAKAILSAALAYQPGQDHPKTAAAKRWVPWIMAYSGARVGEIVQLRKRDVRNENGLWIITITPEAGTVKDKQAREFPLHSHLIELGFAEFVMSAPDGHLFITPASAGDVLGPMQGVKNRISEFVREVVSDPNVTPNHAWRHRFKLVGLEAGAGERVLDAICGHAPRTVGATYGGVTIRAKADAIAKFPRYEVRKDSDLVSQGS